MRLLSLTSYAEETKQSKTTPTIRISEGETTARITSSHCEGPDSKLPQALRYDPELKEWLESNRLDFLHEPLRANGFDDFSLLLDTMRSEVSLTKELISPICEKVGHAARLLGLLELEARRSQMGSLPDTSVWCTNTTSVDTEQESLEEWLGRLGIAQLFSNFVKAGYDDLEHLTLLQKTKMKLTDDVLQQELGITMQGWRHRILMRLGKGTQAPTSPANLDADRSTASCRECKLM
jgi:hypothetical protein